VGNFPRRAVEAEYLAVLRFEDEIEIELRPDRVGATSVSYAWEVRRDGQACIRGSHTVVHVDAEGRPAPLPENMRRAFSPATS
jgi:acyl-CoA thioester hydrolase